MTAGATTEPAREPASGAATVWIARLLQAGALAFPALHPLVRHGGGTLWVLACLGGLVWLWRARRSGAPTWSALGRDERLLLLALLAIPAAFLLSLVNADDWTYVGPKLEKPLQVLLFPLAYLWVRGLKVDLGRAFLWGVMAAAPVMLAVGVWQMAHGAQWAHGAYYRILYGDLALYYLALLVVADLVYLRGRLRWLGWAAMACAFVAVLLSGTRGAWLAGFVFLPWVLWCYRRVLSRRQWQWLGAGALLALTAVVLVPSPIQDRLAQGFHDLQHLEEKPGSSWATRYHLWRTSLAAWREHPWLGTGVGDLHQELERAAAEGRYPASTRYDHAHSLYFDALATTGLVGLGALLAGFFLVPGWYFWRHWRRAGDDSYRRFLALGGLVGLAAFALFGLTEAWFSRMHLTRAFLVHLWVFASALALAGHPPRERHGSA